ncbi:MAG TPA: hypothetical protein VD930_08005, partial [Gemmatimonadales bacterium]|nr:hypothetical protein [Gemmatimonadales bacterium]
SVDVLRAAGIRNLSLDLIFGLPAQLGRDWESDLSQAFGLAPEHLSLYGLTVEPHTVLGHQARRGELTPVHEDQYATEFLEAHRLMVGHGYEHYEVSNAALPGHRSRHNSAYWQRASFIGLGPSAHSGDSTERRWNIREWAAYERAVMAGASPLAGREQLDREAIELEELYLGLRTSEGLPVARLEPDTRTRWEKSGWAKKVQDRLRLTPEGWLRLDSLVPAIAS